MEQITGTPENRIWTILTVIVFLPVDYVRFVSPEGVLFFKIIFTLAVKSYVIFFYLISVNPLPPGKSKIREWIEGLQAAWSPAKPTPVPIPVNN